MGINNKAAFKKSSCKINYVPFMHNQKYLTKLLSTRSYTVFFYG